ncbi:MAG: DUF4136 domain-containing protein [gamma proteobacterium symbiont of Bathyaustriella thionipta]|nr:DUF4136 domain-containing protein [gamma proteobacterium symbiont of Bathyaustriella thionipta]MCU7948734.1 DUF4136 domain-containing protein [gamma proteobacterium symbiont of Bathyaustriella thionipta]MCU7954637.1 DUF4136 domain-containing protein [gamma proteobacterium symbiont of Bathyaustriella thionipta]MCU7955217.1 DUF4136 domain-containing protein [gamma proteobacterium symbiont of Bathyaustriella thionipta]MCU7968235.1 DUF4136 domain-containing protein [gamma proteobacterium symbion
MYYRATLNTIMLCLGFSLFLGGCTSVSTLVGGRHKHDYAQNFEGMQRYNFNPVSLQVKTDPNFIFIQNSGATLAIENGMATKKLRKERNMEPDFWLNYYFTGEQSMTVDQINTLFNYNLGLAWNDKYGTGQGIAKSNHSFSKRTLIIDLVSQDNNRLIWRGSAPTRITADDSEYKKRNALNSAVKVILAPFPPENNFTILKAPVFNE